MRVLPVVAVVGLWSANAQPKVELNELGQVTYGVDISTPIHHKEVSKNYDWLPHNVDPENNPTPPEYEGMAIQRLGNKQEFYEKMIQGCRDYYGKRGNACDNTEMDRVEMSKRQPSSMQNFTDLGFKKIKAPEGVFRLIKSFWEKNRDKMQDERWALGNTYTNHWESNAGFVSVEDTSLRGGGMALKQRIWDASKSILEEWTGQELIPCSLYGIRVYKENSVLATHVDRLPLVSSAIINVDQDLDEDWPLEVYAHDGKAYNISMEPGDMVLYESHSVLHGRPFPLKGRMYANVFVHFEPNGNVLPGREDPTEQYRRAAANSIGGHENDNTNAPLMDGFSDELPVYIVPGSDEAKSWMRMNPDGWQKNDVTDFGTGSTAAHKAAMAGDVDTLLNIAESDAGILHQKDNNGWQPIHEGARGGHTKVVEILVEHGADVNERANHGKGGTPLHLARTAHGADHSVVQYLLSLGALDVGPEL